MVGTGMLGGGREERKKNYQWDFLKRGLLFLCNGVSNRILRFLLQWWGKISPRPK